MVKRSWRRRVLVVALLIFCVGEYGRRASAAKEVSVAVEGTTVYDMKIDEKSLNPF